MSTRARRPEAGLPKWAVYDPFFSRLSRAGGVIAIAIFLFVEPRAYAGIFGASKHDVAEKVATLPNPDSDVYPLQLDFNADGKEIAIESHSEKTPPDNAAKIFIWNWRRQLVKASLEMPRGFGNGMPLNSLIYSPDGQLLAVCGQSGAVVARIWSTTTWTIAKDVTEPKTGLCTAISFARDGKLFFCTEQAGGYAGSLIAYSVGDWELAWEVKMPGFLPITMSISPNGEFAAVAGTFLVVPADIDDPIKKFKQARDQLQVRFVDVRHRLQTSIYQIEAMGPIAWSPNGERVAVVGAQHTEILDPKSGAKLVVEKLENSGTMNVRFTSDGRYYIESDLNGMGKGLGVNIWDGARHHVLQHLPVGDVGSISVSRDGKYLAVGETGRTTIWQLK